MSTRRLVERAAKSAASLTRLARSAPEKPGVPRAMMSALTSGASGTLRMCTSRICSRPRMSGSGHDDLAVEAARAQQRRVEHVGRLVAAMTITPALPSKPSISTSSWLSVCSRSSLPPPKPAPRWRPTASISSMNTMHGAFFFACSNMSRTRAAPTPTNISTKSEPEIEKNGTFASPAIALASSVLPVPGEPTISTPRGMRPPSFWNLDGIAQELDELGDLLLRLVAAGDVRERDGVVRLVEHAGLALAEAERAAATAALHLAHEEDPHADQQQHREPRDEDLREEALLLLGLGLDLTPARRRSSTMKMSARCR
jgi:hypothetical protein